MKPSIAVFVVLFALALRQSAPAEPVSHDDSFSKEGLFKADVSTLKDTQLVAHPDVPLAADQNVLWCGTLQLAWNEAVGLVGEKLHFDRQVPEVDLLNRMDFTRKDLDPDSYVALADFEVNHVEDEIRAALEKTFQGAASPELIPPKPPHPGPDDFVAYAYLYKNLAFATPFPDHSPLNFGTTAVKAFGFDSEGQRPPGALEQVEINDYHSPNDFVIELKTKAANDELILAKVPPAATLEATISSVLGRLGQHSISIVGPGDMLAVPKLNFDLRRDFSELEGLVLEPSPGAKIHRRLVISKAEQLVRFQLNEKGAILKSEAVIAMKAMAMRPRHMMIFNQPFLILMKQKDSSRPYFALWVGNASLLVPAE